MNIQKISLGIIKPYWRNPRTNEKTIEMLKKSITDYGYNVPIILDKNNTIIAGHARYKALLELGFTEADCIVSDMSDTKAKEYRIADNKIHEATKWNEQELILEIKELDQEIMQTYFDDIEIKELVLDDLGFKSGFDVNQNDIDKKESQLDSQHKNIEQNEQDRKVEIICPHCYQTFFLNKEDIKQ